MGSSSFLGETTDYPTADPLGKRRLEETYILGEDYEFGFGHTEFELHVGY